VVPQLLWVRRIRTNTLWLFLISLDVLVGMWLERFIIVVVSLTRDFVTSSFGQYYPTWNDWSILVGTLGFFTACMFLFLRVLPAVSISELKTLVPQAEVTVAHAEEVHDL
jgi:molybdopterin-containing oxidoreductase family membrane subunit